MRSIKEECLSRIILFGEGHLRRVIDEYLLPFNHERNHQGIGNELIDSETSERTGPVACNERIGGLLKFDSRAA